MKIYNYNKKNKKWYQKIDWKKEIIIFAIIFIVLFLIFNFLGKSKNIERAILTSFFISFLISLRRILIDLLENTKKIICVDKNSIKYIELHDSNNGKYISDDEFDDITFKKEFKDIYNNVDKYDGIDCGKIDTIISLKKKNNKIIMLAEVSSKEWTPTGVISIKELTLSEKKYRKKMIIPNSFNNYDELYGILKDKKDKQ